MTLIVAAIILVALPALASAQVCFSDTFTDVATTDVLSHLSDSGGTWTQEASSNGRIKIDSTGTEARHNSAGTIAVYYTNCSHTSADYYVQATVHTYTAQGNIGVVGRVTASLQNFYACYLNSAGTSLGLRKYSGGGITVLASGTVSFATGSSHTIKLVMTGSSLECYADGALVASATDATFTSALHGGIIAFDAFADGTGKQLVDFEEGGGATVTVCRRMRTGFGC